MHLQIQEEDVPERADDVAVREGRRAGRRPDREPEIGQLPPSVHSSEFRVHVCQYKKQTDKLHP